MNVWLTFFLTSAVIVFAGSRLCLLGDAIGEKLQLGEVWVGAFLLAFVTSLPEVVASVSAVLFQAAPDLAFGNIFGSILCNLFLIAVVDMLMGSKLLFHFVGKELNVSLTVMLAIMGLALAVLFFRWPVKLGPVGLDSLMLLLFYFVGLQWVFRSDRQSVSKKENAKGKEVPELKYAHQSLGRVLGFFIFFSFILILAVLKMTESADIIADTTGLGRTFVGSLFLAVVTSLPEFVVSFQAVRVGLYGMSLGNLLGSNIFNIAVIPIADFCLPQATIVSQVSSLHLLSLVVALMMGGIVWMGLNRKTDKRIGPLGVHSAWLIVLYAVGMYSLFHFRNVT